MANQTYGGNHYIAIVNEDRSVNMIAVQCENSSGYLSALLTRFYDEEDRVRKLIAHGAIDFIYPGRYVGPSDDGETPEIFHFDSIDECINCIEPEVQEKLKRFPDEDLTCFIPHIFIYDNYKECTPNNVGWICYSPEGMWPMDWVYYEDDEYYSSDECVEDMIKDENEDAAYCKEKGLTQYL